MRVLVTWGSKRGGTEGLARMVADALEHEGVDAVQMPAREVRDLCAFDAVIVGGALYANRWHRNARSFIRRHAEELRSLRVWFFSSGPLDASAESREIPPTKQVSALMKRVGARGHVTFGGRLDPDARGFIASKMARTHAGDWRDAGHVRMWATEVAMSLRSSPNRSPRVTPSRERLRILLAGLCLFAGLTAIWGGLELVLGPDGSLIHAPLSLLEHTPFHDFLVPGVLLAVFVGGINTLAGALVIRRHPRGDAEAMVSGAVLTTWISIEVLLIRHVHWLHAVYLALGLGIVALASVREKRAGELENTLRAMSRVAVHAFIGWTLCSATMAALLATTSAGTARLVHIFAAPVIFAGVALGYFRGRHAWAPLRAALVFGVLIGLLDLVVVAILLQHDLAMFQSVDGFWGSIVLIVITTWIVGATRGARAPGSASTTEDHARA